jgi:hypothetical protein
LVNYLDYVRFLTAKNNIQLFQRLGLEVPHLRAIVEQCGKRSTPQRHVSILPGACTAARFAKSPNETFRAEKRWSTLGDDRYGVRFGSKAEVGKRPPRVRFDPESRHRIEPAQVCFVTKLLDTAIVNAIAAGSQHSTISRISHRTAVSASVPTMAARY